MGWRTWDRILVVVLPVGAAVLAVAGVLVGSIDRLEGTPVPLMLFVGVLFTVGRMVQAANRARMRLRLRRSAHNN